MLSSDKITFTVRCPQRFRYFCVCSDRNQSKFRFSNNGNYFHGCGAATRVNWWRRDWVPCFAEIQCSRTYGILMGILGEDFLVFEGFWVNLLRIRFHRTTWSRALLRWGLSGGSAHFLLEFLPQIVESIYERLGKSRRNWVWRSNQVRAPWKTVQQGIVWANQSEKWNIREFWWILELFGHSK